MLNIKGVENAALTVQNIVLSGARLSPMPETPIHGLVTPCLNTQHRSPLSPECTPQELAVLAANVVNCASTYDPKIQSSSDHDVMMERATVKVAGVMRENLQLIQNVVSPMVSNVLDQVNLATQKLDLVGIEVPIVEDGLAAIYFNDYFDDLVLGASEDVMRGELEKLHVIPTLELNEYHKLCMSGISGVDDDVAKLVAGIGPDNLVVAITHWLGKIKPRSMLSAAELVMVESRDVAVVMVLMCRNLLGGAIAELGCGEDCRADVKAFMGQMSNRVRSDKARWEAAYDAGQLVISYPNTKLLNGSEGPSIVVHGELYADWLAHGGSPEVIYGAYFTDRAMMVTALDTNRAVYLSAAEKYVLDIRSVNLSQADSIIRSTIVSAIEADAAERGISPQPNQSGKVDEVRYKVRRCLDDEARITKDNIVAVVTNTVCDSLFCHTYAKYFIGLMNQYQRDNPDSDPSTLANVATIDLLVRWVVRSMTIDKD